MWHSSCFVSSNIIDNLKKIIIMKASYDIWLILLSLAAGAFAMYITFDFIEHLYRATSQEEKMANENTVNA